MNGPWISRVWKLTNAHGCTPGYCQHLTYSLLIDRGVDRGTFQQTKYFMTLDELVRSEKHGTQNTKITVLD